MKIEIIAPTNPAYESKVSVDGVCKPCPGISVTDPWGWSDEELEALLGRENFDKLQAGKYQFNIPASRVKLITGERPAKSRADLQLLTDYNLR